MFARANLSGVAQDPVRRCLPVHAVPPLATGAVPCRVVLLVKKAGASRGEGSKAACAAGLSSPCSVPRNACDWLELAYDTVSTFPDMRYTRPSRQKVKHAGVGSNVFEHLWGLVWFNVTVLEPFL